MNKKMLFLLFVFSLFLTSCNNSKLTALEVMLKLDQNNGYIYTNDADISSVTSVSKGGHAL